MSKSSEKNKTLEEMLREQEEHIRQQQFEEEERLRKLKEQADAATKKIKKPKRVRVEKPPVCTPEEEYDLLRALARNDPLGESACNYVREGYDPILRHPLPLSEHRYLHEANLRKIMSCRKEIQAFGCITAGDAWCLEEVYMRGASLNVRDRNGFTPLHIAVQLGHIESIMVLMNNPDIDVNAVSMSGYTPLYIAEASNLSAPLKEMLISRGAKRVILDIEDPPKSILDGRPTRLGCIQMVQENTNLPPLWTGF